MVFVLCGGGFCVDSGGFSVGGDGNRAVVAVFSLFPECGWWWVVRLAWAYIFQRIEIFYIQEQTQEIIIRCNFHNTVKQQKIFYTQKTFYILPKAAKITMLML